MNLEDIMLSEISKTFTKGQILYDSTYMKYHRKEKKELLSGHRVGKEWRVIV